MGMLDFLNKKAEEKPAEDSVRPVGKYSENCALCGKPDSEKKWAGQYWHLKCIRKMKKGAKGMF